MNKPMETVTREWIDSVVDCVRDIYGDGPVALHRPVFEGNEREYLFDCVESNFVSSVGERVVEFEREIAKYAGVRHGVATVNGTAALHVAIKLAGVQAGDEVLTQALSFIATCNAISYAGASPVFIDVDRDTLGMSPNALRRFLCENVKVRDGHALNRVSGRRIAACVPMHTFGFPLRIEELVAVCDEFRIPVVEDAAESLGSYVGARHSGSFGRVATFSFNGNKVITTGGGGMIITDDGDLARRAKHLTTTAKIAHPFEFVHDEIGFNYRMPNLNAALGCAQIERLPEMLKIKREVAAVYRHFFAGSTEFVEPIAGCTPNHWLNAIVLPSEADRDLFLAYTNSAGVMTRPVWRLMSRLPMYEGCQHDGLEWSRWLESRVVNLPSSVPASEFGRLRR